MSTRQASLGEHLRRLAQVTDSELTDGQLLEQFHTTRNEDAFASLVRRHGPMVWSVCRRMLLNETDAEDAFQATFLVLVRKSGSVVPRERVGNWLYGVACLTAKKARTVAGRRNATERQVETMPQPEATGQELTIESLERQAILYEELERLPDRHRAAIVLCDLQGVSRREAARQLAIDEGTLSSRLARGRSKLVQQLKKRSIALTSGAIALALPSLCTTAAPTLVQNAALRIGLLHSLRKLSDGSVSNRTVELSEGVLKTMWLNKLKALVPLTCLVIAAVLGMSLMIYHASAQTTDRKVVVSEASNKPVVELPKKANDQDERVPKKNPKAMPIVAVNLSKIDRSIGKEPEYRSAHQEYCILAMNAEATGVIWLVRDGADMYVDLNGNGDLTEDGEKFVGVYNADAKGFRKLSLFIYPNKKIFGSTIRQIHLQSPYGQIGWNLEAQFNVAKHSEYSTRPIQPSRSARHAPVVQLNGPISVVPHLAHELESELRLMTSIKYTRGQTYPLMLLVGNMGVGKGAQVHCESRELENRLKNTVVEGRLRYTDKYGMEKVTTHRFPFRDRG